VASVIGAVFSPFIVFFKFCAKIMHFVQNLYLVIRCAQSVEAAPLNPPLGDEHYFIHTSTHRAKLYTLRHFNKEALITN